MIGVTQPADFKGELYSTETVAYLLGHSTVESTRREMSRASIKRVSGYPAREVRRLLAERKRND